LALELLTRENEEGDSMYSVGIPRVALTALVIAGLGTGCATRKFVRNRVGDSEKTTTARIEQGENKTGTRIGALEEKQQNDASRLGEIAQGADKRAGEAMQSANAANDAAKQADSKAVQAGQQAGEASQKAEVAQRTASQAVARVESLGDLKLAGSETILFKFGSDVLQPDETAKLDSLASKATGKFSTVEVHGFTDLTGDKAYNIQLSQRRAEAVVRYLTTKHQIPLHRIQLLGFGAETAEAAKEEKPRERNRLSRRVEVKIFSPADGGSQVSSSRSF
jgi:outer membrane protein OmpA-like peptidoglycan-associated protein